MGFSKGTPNNNEIGKSWGKVSPAPTVSIKAPSKCKPSPGFTSVPSGETKHKGGSPFKGKKNSK